ncbi:alpha/beta hydrolase family protein [Chitinophaga niastensis]|uniref:Alpha/beta hydrolase family protein n=1 Tax=Chitinophaga niastensis TaxID=536980 RepID=A0A2P8HVP8_CHINA|nr:alpha/beta fold hydrolase [Chitinophaga niastensis]PSL50302.1 alpha/beta hydrolase family protein [Chitinophaga niastensis]
MKKNILSSLIAMVCLVQFSSAQQKAIYIPTIEPCACPVKVDSSFKTRCGYLIVPENRKKKNSKLIKLPFIIVESKDPDKKKDPVLFTSGGPGNSSLGWTIGITKGPIINSRDCIAFEQRGTKFAIPYIRSYELDTAIKESYRKNLSKDSMVLEGIKRYKKTLETKGIDLSGYNTYETVEDIHDLLNVLHIDSVNLLGGSYSGGLMLAVLQHDSSRIRSLILDSPLPTFVPIDEDEPANFNEALHILSARCKKDSGVLYADLEEKFQIYFNSIIGKTFYINYLENGTSDSLSIRYTKNELLDVIENNLLDVSKIKEVPFIIMDIIKGNHYKYIKAKLDDLFSKNPAPDGMRISVYCADQAAYHSEDIIRQLYSIYPWMEGYHINDVYKAICDCWAVPPVKPITKQPFYSNKPVLLGDGAMDPACRPVYMDMIHHYMPVSQRFLFINRSHGVFGWDQGRAIVQQFLDNPYQKIATTNKDIIAY